MKIGLNIFPLERKKWSGIEIYTYELLRYLVNNNLDIETYSLGEFADAQKIEFSKNKNFGKSTSGSIRKLYYNLFGINKLVDNLDIFHSTIFSLPYNLKAKKKIITIHDFAFNRFPDMFDFKTRMFYKLTLDYSIKKADRIICISKSCLEDFKIYYPDPNLISKTRLVYNGFNDYSAFKQSAVQINSFGEYLLCVGASHKRKNIIRVLKAYSILSTKYPKLNLVVTGTIDPEILSNFLNEDSPIRQRVFIQNYVSEEELVNLYRGAKVLMFPSLYEGFGFPILEAMSCKIPVLTSKTSSCGEVSGYDNKFLVDPLNVEDIANKTELILDGKNYKSLVSYGSDRIREFSWKKMGKDTLDIYMD